MKRSRIQWIAAYSRPSPLTSAKTRYFSIGPGLGAWVRSASPLVLTFLARFKGGFVGLGGCSHPYASDLADGIYIEQGEANPLIPPNPPCALDAGVFRCRRATPATPPRQKGSFLAESPCGGRERSISPPSDQKTRFAGFAVRTRRCGATGQRPGQRGPVRDSGNAKGANLGAYRVCRFAPRCARKRPGTKTQCWRGFAADSPPELQKSAHERTRFGDRGRVSTGGGLRPFMVKKGQNGEGVQKRDEHRLTHRTHLYVTLYTRARARTSRKVTTTCVRCVRRAWVSEMASRNWTPLAADHTTLYTRSPLSL